MPYRITDEQFKSALREAVIQHEQADNPEEKFPPDYKPFNPVWHVGGDHNAPIDRQMTLGSSEYSFLTPEQKAALLEEV